MDHPVVHHKLVTRGCCKQLQNLQSEVLVFNIIIIIIIIIFLAHNLVAQQVFAVCHSAILNLLSQGGGDSFGLLATKKREPPLHKCKDPSLTLYKSRYICLWGAHKQKDDPNSSTPPPLNTPHSIPSSRSGLEKDERHNKVSSSTFTRSHASKHNKVSCTELGII
jgi:hypothetical protein